MVDTWRWPKESLSTASTISTLIPRVAARSRSITRRVCTPLSWESLLTSTSCGSLRIAASTFGAHSRSRVRSSLRRVNSYCALLSRPPRRTSWPALR
ncbi:Uncharacterised protein [Acinetobacter baumannii]|nr:Uncharacterised protein [Acinetobacter baumannii]